MKSITENTQKLKVNPDEQESAPGLTPRNEELGHLSRRIRMLEERYFNIRKKTQLTDQNMIEDNKNILTQIKQFNSVIDDIKRSVADIEEKLKIFDVEMKNTPKKSDVTLLKKYLDFWDPMNFVTEKEARKIISDYLDNIRRF